MDKKKEDYFKSETFKRKAEEISKQDGVAITGARAKTITRNVRANEKRKNK